MKPLVRILAAMVVLLAPVVTLPSPTFGATLPSYAWAYYDPAGAVSGSEGIQYTTGGYTNAYDWIAGQVGICKNGTAVCSTNFIETGIGGGSDTGSNHRQYVRYDNNGTETIWWDSTNLNNYTLYKMRVEYVSGNVAAWKVYRAPCSSSTQCEELSEVTTITGGNVGFTSGNSVYAGAAGNDTQLDPLLLWTDIGKLRYNSGGTWTLYNWSSYVESHSCYDIFQIYGNDVSVRSASC
jgi:hypothetical protein